MLRNIFSLIATLAFLSSFGQSGTINGRVRDKNGQVVKDVHISIVNTVTSLTNDSGEFKLERLKPGSYTVVFQRANFASRETSVVIGDGAEVYLDIELEEIAQRVGVQRISKSRGNAQTTALVNLKIRGMSSMATALTAEDFKKLPAKSVGEVLKSASGASVQDNKFAIIRGLGDRYNFAMINDAPLPSSESDRKAFSFDIFPSNMLDNMMIIKTAGPDLPSEFAGGIILINTKGIPDKNFYEVSLGSGANAITTFRNFRTYKGGKLDFLGIDDGTRALPKGLPEADAFTKLTKKERGAFATSFNSFASMQDRMALPNLSLRYSMGHKINFKNEKYSMGSMFGLTYSNGNNFKEVTRSDFDQSGKIYNYTDKQYTQNVLWGALWNLGLNVGENSRYAIKNMFNVNSEDQVVDRNGTDFTAAQDVKSVALFYQQNLMYSTQVSGEHDFKLSTDTSGKARFSKLNWVGGYSRINRQIPDFRRLRYNKNAGEDTTYQAFIGTSPAPNDGGRFYSALHENSYSASYTYSVPFKFWGATEFKAGGFHQYRQRDFSVRNLGYTIYQTSQFDQNLLLLPVEQIFDPANMNNKGFLISDGTNKSDQYTANSSLHAAFAMLDNKFTFRKRLIWGVRVERFAQNLESEINLNPLKVQTQKIDILPSLNYVYKLDSFRNIRFAVSKTLSRPEFRELAPFSFYDFNNFVEIVGNSKLNRTAIYNVDMKYEIYPKKRTEMIAFTAFYKKFIDPIEQVLGADFGGGTLSTTYVNAKSAENYGAELEMRKSLGFLKRGNPILDKLSAVANIAVIHSRVDVSNVAGASERPLQGQSPYVISGNLSYMNPASDKTEGITVGVSRIGRRIAFVGTGVYPDFYEKPRTVLDAQVNRTFLSNKLDVRISVSDILARRIIFYQNKVGDSNKGFDASKDNVMRNYRVGTTLSFTITYKFDQKEKKKETKKD